MDVFIYRDGSSEEKRTNPAGFMGRKPFAVRSSARLLYLPIADWISSFSSFSVDLHLVVELISFISAALRLSICNLRFFYVDYG